MNDHGPIFPLEIFQLIVAEVASDTTRPWKTVLSDLNSCCLVAKSFIQISREFIFREITAQNELDGNKRAQKLARFLHDNPHFANNVQKLTYRFMSPGHSVRKEKGNTATLSFPDFPGVQHFVVEASSQMPYPHVRIPGINNLLDHYVSISRITHISISSVSRLPLLMFLQCPSLKTLTLHKCNLSVPAMPLEQNPLPNGSSLTHFISTETFGQYLTFVLRYCQCLQEIFMLEGQGYDEQPESQHEPPPLAFSQVRKMTSHSMYEWKALMESSPSVLVFPALRDLTLIDVWDNESIQLTSQHITALETFSIQGSDAWSNLLFGTIGTHLNRLFLASKDTLKSFLIKWTIPRLNAIINFLPTFISALRILEESGILEEFTLDLHFERVEKTNIPIAFYQWKNLDDLLWGQKGRFPALKRVRHILKYDLGKVLAKLSRKGWDTEREDWKMLNEPLRGWREKEDVKFESRITVDTTRW